MENFNKFYKRKLHERQSIIHKKFNTRDCHTYLEEDVYDNMIENAITTFEIPMGIAPGLIINKEEYIIPMATEEPSVIAAQSNAAKIIKINGGINAEIISNTMIGQVAFQNPKESFIDYLEANKKHLFKIANKAKPSIVARGGGIKDITWEIKTRDNINPFLIIYAEIDTQEAMGANIVNTIMEAIKKELEKEFQTHAVMAILSNNAQKSLVKASCVIDPKTLKNSDTIADRIQEASELAWVDPYRAATHNKGIMNGISALALASGNDTRAIEAAAHSYASISGQYSPLAIWTTQNDKIYGEITIPITIGTVGGTINLNPKAKLARTILNNPNKEEMMMISASVGLAQNFAALYALCTDGIQKGHMSLQAKSLILNCGASLEELDTILEETEDLESLDQKTVEQLLINIRKT